MIQSTGAVRSTRWLQGLWAALKSTAYTGQHNLRRIYIRKATSKEYNKIGSIQNISSTVFSTIIAQSSLIYTTFHYKAAGHTFMGTISYYMIIQWDGIRPSIRRWAPGILITRGDKLINNILISKHKYIVRPVEGGEKGLVHIHWQFTWLYRGHAWFTQSTFHCRPWHLIILGGYPDMLEENNTKDKTNTVDLI